MATYQVRTDANGQKILSDPLTGLSSTLATSELPGAVQPDGLTTKVDSAGILSAIGGNLLINDEIWITESGTFTVPVTGWYEVLLIGGGSGSLMSSTAVAGGSSGGFKSCIKYYHKGHTVSVTIGAGGLGNAQAGYNGGLTIFDDISTDIVAVFPGARSENPSNVQGYIFAAAGGGLGGGDGAGSDVPNGRFYGAGGGGAFQAGDNWFIRHGDGYQGAVRLRFWNPAKASGPVE